MMSGDARERASSVHARGRAGGKDPVFWRDYILGWGVLAGGALMYLGSFALNPDALGRFIAKPPQGEQQSNRTELDRAQLSAQVRSLQETVASLQTDLARVKDRPQPAAADTRPAGTLSAGTLAAGEAAEPNPANTLRDARTAQLQQPTPELAPAAPAPQSSPISTASIGRPPAGIEPNASAGQTPAGAQPFGTQPFATQPFAAPVAGAEARPVGVETPPVANEQAARAPVKGRNRATYLLRAGQVPPLPQLNSRGQSPAGVPAGGRDLTEREQAGRNGTAGQPLVLNSGAANVSGTAVSGLRTGSLPQVANVAPASSYAPSTPPPTFGQPTVVPRQAAAGAAAISLSTASSITGLRASWLLLTSNQPGMFAGLTPRYVADRASGTYRLLAGPIANHAEADRMCGALRAESITCGVADYGGSPL